MDSLFYVHKKTNKHSAFIAFLIVSNFLATNVEGHGYMTTPRTRNEFAAQEGVDGGGTVGLPSKEYCTHCLNTNTGVCGSSPNFNYDDYLDSTGSPMPWLSQETYVEGQSIIVKSYLDTPHNGHLELKACALGSASTQECFDTPGHELVFEDDVLYGMPKDPSYPDRGYYAGGQGGGIKNHEMKFKLPAGIYGDEVMLQYKYITANSCSPPGYTAYFNGANSKNEVLPESYWTPGLGDCTPPYPNDGTRGTTWPEQFFNCAEVTITASAPSPPTTAPPPSTTSQPTPSPTQPPTAEGVGCCSWPPYEECSQPNNVWCQESQDRCEGSCSGKWLVSYPPTTPSPTSAPIGSNPTPSPTESPTSVPSKAPSSSPPNSTPAPTPVSEPSNDISCSADVNKSSWDIVTEMGAITHIVSQSPYILSVIASGGASGDGSSVVSEGQAYGVLAAAITIASMDEIDENYSEAKNLFYGYYSGWKRMCENSNSYAYCQATKFCDGGQTACLPGWKHNGDLTTVEGTGAAPDGDQDAILGMIIAVKAVENDNSRPSWYDEVRVWADESSSQFLLSNTRLSNSGSHRIVKLGTCWGGWEGDGNNPSYHSPGHYRAMRDYQLAFEGRSYTLPNFGNNLSLEENWNMVIDTSYKFLETTKCPDSSVVPNWALVKETDATQLEKFPGSFSGSGTPQYEFGSEASRTMWRVVLDGIMYPDESSSQVNQFLNPLYSNMVDHFNPNPTDTVSYFEDGTLETCTYVTNIFSNWWWNGFIFGPVLSTLGMEMTDDSLFDGLGYTQQTMIDAACKKVSSIEASTTYYSRSWQVLSTMTLNGDIAKAARIIRNNDDSTTPAPTTTTTSPPTPAPTTASPPTPAPTTTTTSPPTPAPTTTTTSPPTTSDSEFCCSWNLYNCGVDTYCNTSEDNCQGSCGGAWVSKSSEAMSCLAKWSECTNKEDACCGGSGSCVGNGSYKQCM